MDKSYVVECVRSFAERARQAMDVRQIFLFGSYAKGTAIEDYGDIDVAVITNKAVSDWFEASKQLYRMRRDINLMIEPVLIDSTTDRSGFLAEIRRTGEIIYDSEQV